LDKAASFQVYRLAQLEVARGDKLRITENGFDKDRTHRLNNGETIEVAGFTREGDIEAKGGRVVPRQFGHLDHGYVVTADAAQSKTVEPCSPPWPRFAFRNRHAAHVCDHQPRAREENSSPTTAKD
jgi:hypothetical protein